MFFLFLSYFNILEGKNFFLSVLRNLLGEAENAVMQYFNLSCDLEGGEEQL